MSSEVPNPRGRRRNIPSRYLYWTGVSAVTQRILIIIRLRSRLRSRASRETHADTRHAAERRGRLTATHATRTRRRPAPPALNLRLHHVPRGRATRRAARGLWRVRCPHSARRAASPAAWPRVPIALTIVRLATSFEFGCGTAVGSGSARAGMTSPHPSRDRWARAAGHVTCRSSALHLPFRASRIPAPLASQARVPSGSLALSEVSS